MFCYGRLASEDGPRTLQRTVGDGTLPRMTATDQAATDKAGVECQAWAGAPQNKGMQQTRSAPARNRGPRS